MDLKDESWHSQIQISGVGEPVIDSGSIFTLLRGAMQHLTTAPAPRNSPGGKRIVIVLQTVPFAEGKASVEFDLKLAEVVANLPTDTVDESKPEPGESPEVYSARLDSLGYDPATITMLVCDWFEQSTDGELAHALQWISDPRAKRFRYLNSSQEGFDQAMPQEYESLRHYVLKEYPAQCDRITFRKAY